MRPFEGSVKLIGSDSAREDGREIGEIAALYPRDVGEVNREKNRAER